MAYDILCTQNLSIPQKTSQKEIIMSKKKSQPTAIENVEPTVAAVELEQAVPEVPQEPVDAPVEGNEPQTSGEGTESSDKATPEDEKLEVRNYKAHDPHKFEKEEYPTDYRLFEDIAVELGLPAEELPELHGKYLTTYEQFTLRSFVHTSNVLRENIKACEDKIDTLKLMIEDLKGQKPKAEGTYCGSIDDLPKI